MNAAEARALLSPEQVAASAAWEIPPVPDEIVDRLAPLLHELEDRVLAAESVSTSDAA